MAERRAVEIRYDRGSTGEISDRVIEPLGMIFSQDHWYVVAHCRSRNDVRVFRTDRVLQVQVLDETFDVPTQFSLEKYLREDEEEREALFVELKISPALAQRLRERMPLRIVSEQKVGQNVALTLRTFGVDHAVRSVVSMGSEAEVVGPEVVRQAVIQEVEALHSFYAAKEGQRCEQKEPTSHSTGPPRPLSAGHLRLIT